MTFSSPFGFPSSGRSSFPSLEDSIAIHIYKLSTVPSHLAAELCWGRQDPLWRLVMVYPSRSHSSLSAVLQSSSPSWSPSGECHSPLPTHLASAFFGPSSMLPQLAGICWPLLLSIDSGVYSSSAGGSFKNSLPCCLQQWLLFRCLLGSVSTFAPSVSPTSGSSCHLTIPRGGPVSALCLHFPSFLQSGW